MNRIKHIWQRIRQLSGDDVYERYLEHFAQHHADEEHSAMPLSRSEFFRQWQDEKWRGIKRCC